jgi:hypothetical protein
MKRKAKVYYLCFLFFCIVWAMTSILCYYGIIAFDSKSLGGAMLSGLILSASLLTMFSALKILFDQFWDRFSRKKQ